LGAPESLISASIELRVESAGFFIARTAGSFTALKSPRIESPPYGGIENVSFL
jgi:hypothetical protein